jgi:hypothetical protein
MQGPADRAGFIDAPEIEPLKHQVNNDAVVSQTYAPKMSSVTERPIASGARTLSFVSTALINTTKTTFLFVKIKKFRTCS